LLFDEAMMQRIFSGKLEIRALHLLPQFEDYKKIFEAWLTSISITPKAGCNTSTKLTTPSA
jgi:hypothetical protein